MRPRRYRFALLATTGLLAVGLAGCSNSGAAEVASAGEPDQTASSEAAQPAVDEQERARQFAECMREHGIDMPDPDPDHPGRVRIGGSGPRVDESEVEAALEDCREFMPNGGERPEMSPEDQERMREFAQCMRDNGIDMPDPDPDSGRVIIGGDGRLNPQDPKFQEALEACRDLRPEMRQRTGGNG